MCNEFYVKPTQTINVGQVTVAANSASSIIAANTNRKSLLIATSDNGNTWFGTSNAVTNANGFPMANGGTRNTPDLSGAMSLNWQSAIYVYNSSGGNLTVYYVEELLS